MSERRAKHSKNRRRHGGGFREGWWVLLPAAIVVLGVVLVTRAGGGPPGRDVADAGVEHVHGLGIDPADGVLYAATHNGLFRVPEEGRASRVADRYQDTMGFTVVGANHFLGSGHPDVKDQKLRKPGSPPLLGLIESTDSAETWNSLSLLGEADFHALVSAYDRVYGYDSTNGRFMVSEDKKTWEVRAQIQLASFAVDPEDPEKLMATSARGLEASLDGGRAWQLVQGPSLVFLAWDGESGLWGVGPNGEIYNDVEATGDWEKRSSLSGRPEALLVDGSEIYAAVMNGQGVTELRYSEDGGETWELRYRDR